jgi:hypothetical protein
MVALLILSNLIFFAIKHEDGFDLFDPFFGRPTTPCVQNQDEGRRTDNPRDELFT